MIITIARECGSGGHEVGEFLAEHYNIPLYDKKYFIEKAKAAGVYDEVAEFFEEKPVDSFLYSVVMSGEVPVRSKKSLEQLKKLADEESFVIIGRCGNYIYRGCEGVTSVFIHGEESEKIARTMKRQNLTEKKARKVIADVDEKRVYFHKYYTNEQWGAAEHYDLTLNSSPVGTACAAAIIIQYIEGKQP